MDRIAVIAQKIDQTTEWADWDADRIPDICDALNQPSITRTRRVPMGDAQNWAYGAGIVTGVIQLADSGDPVAKALMQAFVGAQQDFNPLDESVQGMLDYLISKGVMTTKHKAALEALAHETVSWAQDAGVGAVKPRDVWLALERLGRV